jgi:lysozyme family protein
LQGRDTTALWNAKTLQGKDTTGFVRTGQVDAVTSAMIVPNTIVRADVATSFKAPYTDTADYAKAAPAVDSARVAGNSYKLEGKDTTVLWNAKTLQGKDTTALDGRYVNEGQASSVTSNMIVDATLFRYRRLRQGSAGHGQCQGCRQLPLAAR